MKIIAIAFTKNGGRIAKLICDRFEADGYIISTHPTDGLNTFSSLHSITKTAWESYDALVFIGAAGIAVRAIAPYVDNKAEDRAVVVVDEKGDFAIPILSGHIGGANALAKQIAAATDGTAVITTATDINNKFSVDTFAVKNNLHIGDTKLIKEISSRVIDGEKIGLYSDCKLKNIPDIFTDNAEVGICISHEHKKPFSVTLNLIPKNLVLGIGCKRNCETVEESILEFLKTNNIDIHSIKAVSTIDIKNDEKGIAGFCKKYSLPLLTFTADELRDTKGEFTSSEFVQKTVGVDNVCERAVCVAGAELIYKKTPHSGTAIAAGTLKIDIDFEEF